MLEAYRTVASRVSHEIPKIKGSRFIATVAPAGSRAAAEAVVEALRRCHPGARHTCFAYRLGAAGEVFRYSDDGEPSGTAGRPILQRIEGRDLTGVVVVVTRYFGGTKLGAGGLLRAYAAAAAAGLDQARVIEVPVTRRVVLRYPYAHTGAVQATVAAAGCTARASQYGATVRQELEVPIARFDAFAAALHERTAGQVEVEVLAEEPESQGERGDPGGPPVA